MTHSPETVPRGILQCFTHFGYRNGLRIRGSEAGRDYQDLSSESFSRTMSKHFVGESVTCSIISAIEKKLGIKEGAGIKIFRQNYFVSQYRNISKMILSVFH